MTKSLTTLGGESEILGGESSPPNSPRINTEQKTAFPAMTRYLKLRRITAAFRQERIKAISA